MRVHEFALGPRDVTRGGQQRALQLFRSRAQLCANVPTWRNRLGF
jgi:hypothetical protein